MKTVIRERGGTKTKVKKVKKAKTARPKKRSSPPPESGERRRSGRVAKSADYKERDDEADEEEMLDGVAEWQYGDSSDEMEVSGSEESGDEVEVSDEGEEEVAKPTARGGRQAAAAAASKAKPTGGAKPAVKASVLAQLQRGGRSSRASKGYEMDLDD